MARKDRMGISAEVLALREEMISWRRDIHMHPELGFSEHRTSALVRDALHSFGFDEILTDFCPAHTAVVGILRTGRPGHVVGLRADMDALPMQDEKDVPYRSQTPGVCHACGHDAHTAALLGVAKYCAEHREQLCGTLKFVFQPAEEGPAPGGAKYIVESGVLDDVEAMIGGHQSTYASVGQVLIKSGTACAGGHAFKLTLTGIGTHAVSPQDGSDVIATAMQIIDSWQSMLTRQVDPQQPVVLSVCSIHAGEEGATNVLPSTATLSGTIRTFSDSLRENVLQKMRERAEAIARFNGCECMMEAEYQFPVLVNDDAVTQIIRKAAIEVAGPNAVFAVPEPSIGSEDFAQYASKIPASYFMFGVRNNEKGFVYGGHHPKFDLDEDGLLYDAEIFLHALHYLLPLRDR